MAFGNSVSYSSLDGVFLRFRFAGIVRSVAMTDKNRRTREEPETDALDDIATLPRPDRSAIWRSFWITCLGRGGLATLLVAAMVGQCLTVAYYTRGRSGVPAPGDGEIPLGNFCCFSGIQGELDTGRVTFSLFVVMDERASSLASSRLSARKYRVRQNVEELLRQAHVADFEDPSLAEIKRRMQERINATLGLRAVSDVLIVNLDFQGTRPGARKTLQTAVDESTHYGQFPGS